MKRLLFIAHRVPYPPDKGERVRAFHEIKALSAHYRVTLAAPIHHESEYETAKPLTRWCEELILAPAGGWRGIVRGGWSMLSGRSATEAFFCSPRMRKLLERRLRGRRFDIVLAYCSSMGPLAVLPRAGARIMDLVDVDSAKWAAYAESARWPMRALYRRESLGVSRLERQAMESFDAVMCVSGAEARAVGLQSPKIIAVGNGVDTEYFSPPGPSVRAETPSVVFTGTMDYRPNIEAVCWFVREVWPGLKRSIHEITFTIVGRNPSRAVRRLADSPGITVTGEVPDVRPYLASAGLAVAPLLTARGVQNKVLEAMSMGCPVVASGAALEGLDVRIGQEVLRADSPQQWRRNIEDIVSSAELRDRLGRAARECVTRKYRWGQRMRPLLALCDRLTAAKDTQARAARPRLPAETIVS